MKVFFIVGKTRMQGQMVNNIEEISNWVANLNLSSVPLDVQEKTKLQNLSVLASLFSGAISSKGKKIHDSIKKWDQGNFCTLLPNQEASLESSLFAHSSYSMAYDFDDYCFMGHTGHSSILTPLVLGEYLSKKGQTIIGKEILTAQIAANEIAGRIGALCLIGPLNGQSMSFIHLVGAAIAASKLMGHSPDQIKNTLGIALMQPNNMLYPGFFSPSKLITASVPILAGLRAAQLADSDLVGSHEILEPKNGLPKRFSFSPKLWVLEVPEGGRKWVTKTMVFKSYPGAAYTNAASEVMEKILETINPSDIQKVKVLTTSLTTKMEELGEELDLPVDQIRINFSVKYSLAVMLAHPTKQLTPATIEDCLANNVDLESFANIIHLSRDSELEEIVSKELEEHNVQPFSGQLWKLCKIFKLTKYLAPIKLKFLEKFAIMLKSGGEPSDWNEFEGLRLLFPAKILVKVNERWSEFGPVIDVRGSPTSPITTPLQTVKDKFRQGAEPFIGPRVGHVENMVLGNWSSFDIQRLWQLLKFTP